MTHGRKWLVESVKVKHVFHGNEQNWLGAKKQVCDCYLFPGDLWLWMAANLFHGKSLSGPLWQQQIWEWPALGDFTVERTTDAVSVEGLRLRAERAAGMQTSWKWQGCTSVASLHNLLKKNHSFVFNESSKFRKLLRLEICHKCH